jgi:hypothetical protein
MTQSRSETDRRHYQRVQFSAPAELAQGPCRQSVQILDLSLNGVLVDDFGGHDFDLSQPLHLTLSLTDNAAIAMELRYVHRGMDGATQRCGFRCSSIDLDSIAHLRRLVELNLGDSSILERNLSELLARME